MKWIDIKEKQPNVGDNIIAIGTWFGEISEEGESDYMGIGQWQDGNYVSIDCDGCATDIVDVTHWMPLPKCPII